jgi:hypothetical protein
MTRKYMTPYESEMLEAMQEVNELKVIVHNLDKKMQLAKERIEILQEKLFDMEDKYGNT